MKEITKANFINTWASEWDERTGWKVSEEYHKQCSEQLEYLINQEAEKRIAERLREELIAYDNWVGEKYIDNYRHEIAPAIVDEYLNGRNK